MVLTGQGPVLQLIPLNEMVFFQQSQNNSHVWGLFNTRYLESNLGELSSGNSASEVFIRVRFT